MGGRAGASYLSCEAEDASRETSRPPPSSSPPDYLLVHRTTREPRTTFGHHLYLYTPTQVVLALSLSLNPGKRACIKGRRWTEHSRKPFRRYSARRWGDSEVTSEPAPVKWLTIQTDDCSLPPPHARIGQSTPPTFNLRRQLIAGGEIAGAHCYDGSQRRTY